MNHSYNNQSIFKLIALSCALIVANLYYAQPLVADISSTLHMAPAVSGLVVTFTQLGYAIGLLFVVPLSDILENLKLIRVILSVAVIGLLMFAFAHRTSTVLIASMLIGIGSVAAQILVPYAAHLSPESKRGAIVGSIMSGLLLGIMLARPVASFLTAYLGWTAIFKISALLTSGLIILLSFQLPKRQPSATGGYLQMLKTLVHLFRHEALLRRRAFYQACLFGSFSLFWTVMPMWLADQYHFTQRGIAVFALVGVSGAIAAPIAGRLADRGYARHVTRAAFLTALSAMLMTCLPLKNTAVMLLLLVLAAVLLDMAVTGNLIVGQQIIFSLGDAIRGRVNGLFMAAFFLGGAFGSSMGSALYAYGGWPAAALLAIALPCLALVYDLLTNS